MEAFRNYFKVKLPKYLKALPIPKTFGGFSDLSREEWLELLPLMIMVGIVVYLVIAPLFGMFSKKEKRPRINKKIRLEEDKVVDTVDVKDIADKKVFCRCWKSKKFPYCDGSHNSHNKETGDNVGPLKIVCSEAETVGKNKQ